MKRYLKYALLIMVVLLPLVMGGCQPHYSIYIEYENNSIYMEDKMIDILIPEKKLNPAYMEFNSRTGHQLCISQMPILRRLRVLFLLNFCTCHLFATCF